MRKILRRNNIRVIHANFIFSYGHFAVAMRTDSGISVVTHERSAARLPLIKTNSRRPQAYVADIGNLDQHRQERPVASLTKQVLLSVGALNERKGHYYLVNAVGQLRHEFLDLC